MRLTVSPARFPASHYGREVDVIKDKRNKIRVSSSDKIFDLINNTIMIIIVIVVAYPLYYVVIASLSDPDAVNAGDMIFFPIGGEGYLLNIEGYRRVFQDPRIWRGYFNTIIYAGFGTAFGVTITTLAAFSLSRRDLVGRGIITALFVFTMFFGGGLIPTFMVVRQLGLVNTREVMILLGSFSVFNLIITRAFFESTMSQELQDAAFIDGCGNGRFFFSIALTLSKAIVAVLTLFYVVGHWNSFFTALIYLNDVRLYPLQLVLRDILIGGQMLIAEVTDMDAIGDAQRIALSLRYAVIIVSSVPVLIMYPFVQKFFVRGVMIGALKG